MTKCTHICQHVHDPSISKLVNSLVGGDKHSQRPWASQWQRGSTVLEREKQVYIWAYFQARSIKNLDLEIPAIIQCSTIVNSHQPVKEICCIFHPFSECPQLSCRHATDHRSTIMNSYNCGDILLYAQYERRSSSFVSSHLLIPWTLRDSRGHWLVNDVDDPIGCWDIFLYDCVQSVWNFQ